MNITKLLPLVLLFLSLSAQSSLYDELKFLEEASTNVQVHLPGEEVTKKKKQSSDWVEDSISTGQAGILKKPLKTTGYDTVPNTPKRKKRLRFRSR